ncbi:hypothetical protein QFC21_004848 [Naganishia friedmannii]|uniref:Uncharacterized protein n=1 Tax=Naganishia friedmannii TaxID=89922 RepID=A0ACC2VCR7_9TREE|nr:hypothetical protein QFC21_004848 [Naganishia friedmannii]
MPKAMRLPDFPLSGLVPIEKPSGPTSMRTIDLIKPLLCESPLFHDPTLTSAAEKKAEVKRLMKHRGGLKIGQGGTLDPLADGVLVIGVGKGTKLLSQFLHCTKSYTTTALLGSCTTTYDSEGPILSTAPWQHVTREIIEQALDRFRGEIMQVPPIFSALKMDGKPLYEYARSNTPLPRPISARRANISLLQLESFTPASVVPGDGGHTFKPPYEQLSEEEREVYFRMSRLTREAGIVEKEFGADDDTNGKGKKGKNAEKGEPVVQHIDIPDLPNPSANAASTSADASTATTSTLVPPTFTIRMTVSSGTYVRSIVHDLALSIGSAAHVVTLTRTRQGRFALNNDPEGLGEIGTSIPETETATTTITTKQDTSDDSNDADAEWYVHDPEGPGRFDFGDRKTGCIPWSVFERAIAERNAARKAAAAAAAAEEENAEKEKVEKQKEEAIAASEGVTEQVDEEGQANAVAAAPAPTPAAARWQPKDWEKEFYARFVPC